MKIRLEVICLILLMAIVSSCQLDSSFARRNYTFELSDYKINHRKKIGQIKIEYFSKDSIAMNKWLKFLESSKSDTLKNQYVSNQLNLALWGQYVVPNMYLAGLGALPIGIGLDYFNLIEIIPPFTALTIMMLPTLIYGGYVIHTSLKYSRKITSLSKIIPEINETKYVYPLSRQFIKKSK